MLVLEETTVWERCLSNVCVWLSWCWEHYSMLTSGKDKCSPQPHSSYHADSQRRELAFSLIWNALLSWDIWSLTILQLANDWTEAALFFLPIVGSLLPSHLFICSLTPATQVGPSSFHLCLFDFKDWLQDSPVRFLWPCCSWHVSGYHNILRVLHHVEGAPDEVWRSVEVFICSQDSLEIPPAGQQDLWAAAHCPEHFLEIFLLGWVPVFNDSCVTPAVTSLSLAVKDCCCLVPTWLVSLHWAPWLGVGFWADTGFLLETPPELGNFPTSCPVGRRTEVGPRG